METICVLSIEDSAGDARLIQEMLRDAISLGWDLPQFELVHVPNLSTALTRLDAGGIDVILADLDLPDSRAEETLAQLRAYAPTIPVVVLTGREDETLARDAVRAGAEDYLFKKEMSGSLLAHALLYAIERQHTRAALQRAYDELEQRVQERTHELELTNVRLQQEVAVRQSAEKLLQENHKQLLTTLHSIGDGVIATDEQLVVTLLNHAAALMTGTSESKALGQPLEKIFRPHNEQSGKLLLDIATETLQQKAVVDIDGLALIGADNSKRTIAARSTPIVLDTQEEISGVVLVLHDQTQEHLNRHMLEMRLALIEYAADHTLDELLTRTLDEVGAFVDSPIGFYHFVEADQRTISLQQWSSRTLREFCQAEGKGHRYDIAQAGVWVECVHQKRPVIHNDYAALPHKKGLPPGHAEVIRELVVPVMRGGQVVAIMGVGNKPRPYTEQDIEIVSYLADVTWEIVRRKRAEEGLRRERDRMRCYLDTVETVIVALDTEGRVTLINRKGCQVLGYEEQEIVGRNWFSDFLPQPEGTEVIYPIFLRMMTGELAAIEYFENPVRTRSGELCELAWHNALLYDDDGRIIGTLSAGNDITDRKRVEEKLRESLTLLNESQQIAHIGSWELDITTNRLTWSDETYRIFGRQQHEFGATYEAFIESVHPDDRIAVDMAYWGSLREGRDSYEIRHRVIRPDGEVRTVYEKCRHVRDDAGRPLRSIGIVQDITEQVRAQEAREREMCSLEQLAQPVRAAVTAEVLGQAPLNQSQPQLFAELVERYGQTLELAWENKVYRIEHPISTNLRLMAKTLGQAGAGPRDVVQIHITALQQQGLSASKAQAYVEEGRLLLVELMGYLTEYYRNYFYQPQRDAAIGE